MEAERIRVLYVFGGEQASGAEIVMERLIYYNLQHVEPHILISPGKFAQKLRESGKPYKIIENVHLRKLNRSSAGKIGYYFKSVYNHFAISKQVIRYAKANRIDHVHAVTIVPASYCIPAIGFSKLLFRKIHWLWSDYDIRHFAGIDHLFASFCNKMYDLTLAASGAVMRKYKKSKSISVLYNGLDPEIYFHDAVARKVFRNEWKINEGTIVFGIAGVISPRKGQVELIKAFVKASIQTGKNALLLLAGDFGSDFPDYNNEVVTLAERNANVKYIGYVSNMFGFFNGCDVVVNNSTAIGSEPLGTTIYEAMSCETIAIGSNTGGTPEIINHGINGFLFEPDNEPDLVKTIIYLINHVQSLDEIRSNARKRVKEKFGYDTMIDKYNRLLKQFD